MCIRDRVIGESLIGKLEVRNGARTVALTTTVGTRDHDTRTDGFLTVEGTNATLPARFESGGGESGGLFVATGTGTDALMTVSGGGVMTVTRLSPVSYTHLDVYKRQALLSQSSP